MHNEGSLYGSFDRDIQNWDADCAIQTRVPDVFCPEALAVCCTDSERS